MKELVAYLTHHPLVVILGVIVVAAAAAVGVRYAIGIHVPPANSPPDDSIKAVTGGGVQPAATAQPTPRERKYAYLALGDSIPFDVEESGFLRALDGSQVADLKPIGTFCKGGRPYTNVDITFALNQEPVGGNDAQQLWVPEHMECALASYKVGADRARLTCTGEPDTLGYFMADGETAAQVPIGTCGGADKDAGGGGAPCSTIICP